MPGIIQLQRQYNPFQQMLPSFVQNLVLQNMSQQWKDKALEEQRKIEEQKELRGYLAAGYRESEAHRPEIEVAGRGLMAPKTQFETRMIGGRPYLVKAQKRYGETETTPLSATQIEDAEQWKTLPKRTIGNKIVIPQKNTKTGKIIYDEFGTVENGKPNIEPEKLLSLATGLRKEFSGQSKTFIEVRDAYNRIAASAEDPSAAGDLALIFNFMKVLDPGSVVREGEFATAETAGSIPQRIWAKYNKVLQGERLSPEQRKDFVQRGERLYKRQEQSHKKLIREYSRIGTDYGVPSSHVIVDYLNPAQPIEDFDQPAHRSKAINDQLRKRYGLE